MTFVIGIDEAGYGPNLGPIVVGGTLWQVADSGTSNERSNGGFTGGREFGAASDPLSGTFADSKKLYSQGSGLGRIEQPILALLGCVDSTAKNRNRAVDLFATLTGQQAAFFEKEPGYYWHDINVPQSCAWEEVLVLEKQIRQKLADHQTQCLSLASTMVFPQAWNDGLIREGNKASFLSALSCRLVDRLLKIIDATEADDTERVLVYCDKHGGRNHYAAILQHEMDCGFVTVLSESANQSTYSWQDESGRAIEITFTAKGESQTPVAVASMVAKYLRELAMAGWNRFWQREIPELQPTAGYPQDAKRFRRDIAHTRQKLHIPENAIWRLR
jgi:ribonuclease HII